MRPTHDNDSPITKQTNEHPRPFPSFTILSRLRLHQIEPMAVAAYIGQHPGSKLTVKQHLTGIQTMFDWLVVGQVVPMNPAASVRGPKHVI